MTQPQFQQKKQQEKIQQQSLNSKGDNAYAVAWKKVLDQLPEWRQKEVIELAATKDFDNRHYTDFIQAVTTLAEES